MKSHHKPYDLPLEVLNLLEERSPDDIPELVDVWNMVPVQTPRSDARVKQRIRTAVAKEIQAKRMVSPRMARHRVTRPPLRLVVARLPRLTAVAACLLAAVTFSFLLAPDITTVRVPDGTLVAQVTLPDGSSATLSAGTLLSFPETFEGDVRRVKLHGMAFFDVEESGVPFEVSTFDAVTRVLGTTFSVNAWPGNLEASSRIVVASGRVEVRTASNSVVLDPGQMTTVVPETGVVDTPVETRIATALSWRTGGLSYSNELLGNVMTDLEHRYDMTLKAPASIRLRRISIQKTQAPDASEVIGDIAATIGIRYRAIHGGYELYLQ